MRLRLRLRLRRNFLAVLMGLMVLPALLGGILAPATASADAFSNPYHSSAGFNHGLAACRWFANASYAQSYVGSMIHNYTTPDYDAMLTEAGNAYGADSNWGGFYQTASNVDYGWDSGYPNQSAINTLANGCSVINRVDGNQNDYVHEFARWNPCQILTVSSSGPNIDYALSELATITGLPVQRVSSGGMVTVEFDPSYPANGIAGQTFIYSPDSVWFAYAHVHITPYASGPLTAKLILHEMGHAFGIGHVGPANEIMGANGAVSSTSVSDYNEGDYIGLWSAGIAAGPNGCG